MSELAQKIPRHVAIIMDGNGRWAVQRGLPRHRGHREGAKSVREVVRGCRAAGVQFLTLYAFSLANWARPKIEVTALMRLLVHFARREVAELREREISVGVIGRPEDLPPVTRRALGELIDKTACGRRMRLSLALSYGGRNDIVKAAREAAERVSRGQLAADQIDEAWIRAHLSTGDLPDPDLVIRTGGEQRFSDFLAYESVYAEFYFSNLLWPEFTEASLAEAFRWYSTRERRFGRTSAQLRDEADPAVSG
jgi:undecaprenyl diphosphate synthase